MAAKKCFTIFWEKILYQLFFLSGVPKCVTQEMYQSVVPYKGAKMLDPWAIPECYTKVMGQRIGLKFSINVF